MRQRLVESLAARLPFFYGWVILACVCAAGFSRQGPAVATLSIFVAPMTGEFGWSRTALSAAVSLGGVLGAIVSPFLGPLLDRNGARAVLVFAVLFTGIPILLLAFTPSLAVFYLLYCTARMNFAGPFDLGIYGSIVNWFSRRRALATSITTAGLMAGVTAMPMIAHAVMQAAGWRNAWLAVGATVLVVGLLPTWLLHVRRPEDIGQRPDGDPAAPRTVGVPGEAARLDAEPAYSRREAMATPAFWLLVLYTLLVYPGQAGISLHQAPLLLERGLAPAEAAAAVSTFALLSGIAGFAVGFWPRRVPLRFGLALAALCMGASSAMFLVVRDAAGAYAAASMFGIGIGGLLTLLPIAWAEYFGRASYGAIRGAALTVQVGAQALGPLLAGLLRDATGNYTSAMVTFAVLGALGLLTALAARPPASVTAVAKRG